MAPYNNTQAAEELQNGLRSIFFFDFVFVVLFFVLVLVQRGVYILFSIGLFIFLVGAKGFFILGTIRFVHRRDFTSSKN